ncbi:hypothetical protein [Pendulispora albinea]|uniref:Uncharacterized protein n=1 Tax=Pendulispora albinea TaxID=2741071 RepID=A0ABZ2MAW3_9BACT
MAETDGANIQQVRKLRKLYREDPAARSLLDYLAGKSPNGRLTTTVDELLLEIQRAPGGVSRAQLTEVLRELDMIGCGQYIVGRHGHPSRFLWSVEMVSVGAAAARKRDEIIALTEDTSDEDDRDEGKSMKRHVYNLRHELAVELQLPSDLTPAEASRLAKFIETLPIV